MMLAKRVTPVTQGHRLPNSSISWLLHSENGQTPAGARILEFATHPAITPSIQQWLD
ncbi:MAG: hypothetical protein JWM58_4632 [Rhizobium sp.]|nr:hypothetical protein [Rhizobium sp.]